MDYATFFLPGNKVTTVKAPGRLDVMGGIADYSGSLVLEMPVDKGTTASVSIRSDDVLRVHSANAAAMGKLETVEKRFPDFVNRDGQISYDLARKRLAGRGAGWAAYVIGCFLVLAKEKGVGASGMDAWIESDLPSGRGVSASAALEVSTMAALCQATGLELGKTELPILCQRVENLVVGAPCGLMDQLTSYLGEKNRLLPILCQPALVQPAIQVPSGIHFIGIDSGAEHSIGGSPYIHVRVAAFMGYTIIALASGADVATIERARRTRDWSGLPYKGYLANVPPATFERELEGLLPGKLTGKAFSEKYGCTIDVVTEISPNVEYLVSTCTRHPVMENARVNEFARVLQGLNTTKGGTGTGRISSLVALGDLMVQSHRSYSACRLGHPATDALVDAVAMAGPGKGVFGAKITGGGSGGTVCVLCDGELGMQTAHDIAGAHWAAKGRDPVVFTGSTAGPGSARQSRRPF